MNARLRARHRATFVILALALPPFAWKALASRPHSSPVQRVPLVDGGFGTHLSLHLDRGGIELRGSLAQDDRSIRVLLGPDWNEPDLLLYWSPTQPSDGKLPPDARLLGVVGSMPEATFQLPVDRVGNWFCVFSLAKHELLGFLEAVDVLEGGY